MQQHGMSCKAPEQPLGSRRGGTGQSVQGSCPSKGGGGRPASNSGCCRPVVLWAMAEHENRLSCQWSESTFVMPAAAAGSTPARLNGVHRRWRWQRQPCPWPRTRIARQEMGLVVRTEIKLQAHKDHHCAPAPQHGRLSRAERGSSVRRQQAAPRAAVGPRGAWHHDRSGPIVDVCCVHGITEADTAAGGRERERGSAGERRKLAAACWVLQAALKDRASDLGCCEGATVLISIRARHVLPWMRLH